MKKKIIIITRQTDMSYSIYQKIENKENVKILPLIDIKKNYTINKKLNIKNPDAIIFISKNSIINSKKILSKFKINNAKLFTIGKESAFLLKKIYNKEIFFPKNKSNSQKLIEILKKYHIYKKKIIIIKGKKGEKTLKKELKILKCSITQINIYFRKKTKIKKKEFNLILKEKKLKIIIISSLYILYNLIKIIKDKNKEFLKNIFLITISKRIQKKALEMNLKNIFLSKNVYENEIIQTIKKIKN